MTDRREVDSSRTLLVIKTAEGRRTKERPVLGEREYEDIRSQLAERGIEYVSPRSAR